jgi:hypothetical protein
VASFTGKIETSDGTSYELPAETSPDCSADVPVASAQQTVEELAAPLILDLTQEAEQMAADRDREIAIAYIYVIEAGDLGLFKIGRANDIKGRLPSYRTECPVPCHAILVASVPGTRVGQIEAALHKRFSERRRKGEWFALTPADVASLPTAIRNVSKYATGEVKRDLRRFADYNSGYVLHQRRLEQELEDHRKRNAIPIAEYVLDRIQHAMECGEKASATLITRELRDSVGRKPMQTHDAIRTLLIDGQIALVNPRRNPDTGLVWFDSYRECSLIAANATCIWEETICHHEVLVARPDPDAQPSLLPQQRPPRPSRR